MTALPFSKIRKFVFLLAFIIIIGGIGYRLGERNVRIQRTAQNTLVINETPPADKQVDFSLFWDVWQRLETYYIDRTSIDAQKMTWGAISGMVNSLGDPYTIFLPPKENKEFKEDLGGEFEGIGAQLGQKDGQIIVVAPLKDSPAEQAGILPGDYILKVNDEETTGWTVPQAVTKIRGARGTSVKLSVLHERANDTVDITITRNTINVPSVEHWVKNINEVTEISGLPAFQSLKNSNKKVAYLRLTRFGDHTNEDWTKAVGEILRIQSQNGTLAGLVFDLRNNPGGYLDGSVYIASEFVKNGTIVTQENSDGSKEPYTVNRAGKLLTIPLVVLVNKGSASAAEIVAGALRDFKRAKLVGETTFGKGSVQTPQELPNGAGLHITTGKWLLPSGDWIDKKGVTPDVEIKLDPSTAIEATMDAQLAGAIEVLLK